VDRPDILKPTPVDSAKDGSMRVLEYAVCALAAIAALLLGLLR
jgi:hypothetical protein